jgi:hypothetical protein
MYPAYLWNSAFLALMGSAHDPPINFYGLK